MAGHLLSTEAVRKTAAMVRRLSGTPRGPGGPRYGGSRPGKPPMRTGKVYSTVTAGTADKPGTGEVIFDRIERAGLVYVDPDTANPQRVYNVSPVSFEVGARVLCHWDQTMVRNANAELTAEAGWVVSDRIGGGSDTPDSDKMLFLCKTATQQVTTDDPTPIVFQGYSNFSIFNHQPVSFDAGATFGGIFLNRVGYYLLGYDVCWDGPLTSAGGATVTVEKSVGSVYLGGQSGGVGTTTVLPCSTQLHEYTKIKTSGAGANIAGNAHKTTLWHNTDNLFIVRLYTEDGSATHNRFYLGNNCSLWARYLHNMPNVVGSLNL